MFIRRFPDAGWNRDVAALHRSAADDAEICFRFGERRRTALILQTSSRPLSWHYSHLQRALALLLSSGPLEIFHAAVRLV